MIQLSVAEGVHRVEDAYTNWYAIEDGDALTIVDTGHPRSWRSLFELLRRLGRPPAAIEAVVLSMRILTTWASRNARAHASACRCSRTSVRFR
jgi:hypothetical protein